ncbi:MAG: hypothetical protein HC836_16870 [Richelia sp. RM2_1_2]|nr:hypothetical protein [Richelia sp. RM2_1_2]
MVLLAIEENYAISAIDTIINAERMVYENDDESMIKAGLGSFETLEALRS